MASGQGKKNSRASILDAPWGCLAPGYAGERDGSIGGIAYRQSDTLGFCMLLGTAIGTISPVLLAYAITVLNSTDTEWIDDGE